VTEETKTNFEDQGGPVNSGGLPRPKSSKLSGSVSVVSGATAISRVLGLVRVQLMASYFGASMAADAFFVAYRIPNLFRDLFAEGSLSTAFVPVFKKTLVSEGAGRAQQLSDRMFTLLFFALAATVLLGIATASWFVYVMAGGFAAEPDKFQLTVLLTRWMFPYLMFVSLSALLMGILNSYGKFGIPALASSMFNIAMIFAMLFLYDAFEVPVHSLIVGVLLGGVGQFAIQVPSLYRVGSRLRFDFKFRDPGIKAVGKLMAPMIIGLSATRINIFVATLLASMQGGGAVSYLVYSYQLMHFPQGVFAVAIGTVTLPRASELVARGDVERLADTIRSAARMAMYLIIPSAVYLAFFNEDLINAIYLRGAFTAFDATEVSWALFWYSLGLPALSGVRVFTPIFYAFSDSKTPMRYSVIAVVANIVLAVALLETPGIQMGFAGLAAATSAAGWLNLILLIVGLRRRKVISGAGSYIESIVKTTVGATAMALALYAQPFDLSFGMSGVIGKALELGLTVGAGGLVYWIATLALGLAEAQRPLRRLRRR
jgi:putative peptidoglycan lipid II flippase